MEDTIDIQAKHEQFVKRICETKMVYGLENEEGFATSFSNEYEDENGEAIEMICFWSEPAYARACAKDGWEDYNLGEITLADFVENWCTGMHHDDVLVGTEFDANMFGLEVEPLVLVKEIITELKSRGETLTFENYESLDELESLVDDNLS